LRSPRCTELGCALTAAAYGLRVPVVRRIPLLVLSVLLLAGCDHGSSHPRGDSRSPFTRQEVRRAFAEAGLPLSSYVGGFTGPAGWKITAILQSGFDTTVAVYEEKAPRTFVTIDDQRVLVRRNVTVNYPPRSRKLPRIERALALLDATRTRVSPPTAKRAIQQRAREWSSGGKIADLSCRSDPADSGSLTCEGSPVECQGGARTPIDRWSVDRGATGEPVINEPKQKVYCIVTEDSEDATQYCQSHPYLKCEGTEP
jgi:hypothetical protein